MVACGVIVIGIENGHSKILNEAVCISHSTNILGKGRNPSILPLDMGK